MASTLLPSARSLLLGLLLLLLVGLLVQQLHTLLQDPSILPPDDFVEYWSAGQLNATGQNPYDPTLLHPLQRAAGRDEAEAVMMWNPPWTLTLVMPFGLMPPRMAQLLWLFLSFLLIGISADWLWRIYDGVPQYRWVSWLLALTFLPTLFVLRAGQIGPFILFGSVAFLGLLRSGYIFAAGAGTVLLAIKPHLVYLFWLVLLYRGLLWDRRMLFAGFIVGASTALLPLATNPQVYHQYWEALTQRPPAQWQSPTLGTVLRLLEGESNFSLQFVPALLGFTWLIAWRWHQRQRAWNWYAALPGLLLVSFVTASYGAWPFDLIILLPAVIQRAAELSHAQRRPIITAIILYTIINGTALLLNRLRLDSFWFIVIAPALLLAYWRTQNAITAYHSSAPTDISPRTTPASVSFPPR